MSPPARLLLAETWIDIDHDAHGSTEDFFESLFNHSGFRMARVDPDLRLIDANEEFRKLIGRTGRNITGHSFLDFVHPGIRGQLERDYTRFADSQRHKFVGRAVFADSRGATSLVRLTCVAVRDGMNNLAALVMIVEPEGDERFEPVAPHEKKILSSVDAQILEGVAYGESTVRIASKLYLSRQGVEYHVGVMLRRLSARNRASLVSKAYSIGILKVGTWPPKVAHEYIK